MSGILTAAIFGAQQKYVVTLGGGGGGADVVGYVSGSLGTLSPSINFRGAGTPIFEASSSNFTNFYLLLDGVQLSNNLFRRIFVENGSGTRIQLNASDASFQSDPAFTQWIWGSGSSRIWSASDVGEQHYLLFDF